MSIIPKTEAELIRLKTQMEVIRTICPILAITLQIIISDSGILKFCSTWNIPLKTKNPQKSKFADFFIFQKNLKKTQKLVIFLFLARGRQ